MTRPPFLTTPHPYLVEQHGEAAVVSTMARLTSKLIPAGVPATDPDLGECWTWTGGQRRPDRGYGGIWAFGANTFTHRLAWLLAFGPVPDGMRIVHACGVPLCCRPTHLRAETPAATSRAYAPPPATHCGAGHELTGDNLCIGPAPRHRRRCRTCRREEATRRRAAAVAARANA